LTEGAATDGPPRGAKIFRFVSLGKEAGSAVLASNAYEPEDEFRNYYIGASHDQGLLEPPYNPCMLDRLTQENNALGPCIEAMVTNIDGTGYDFVKQGQAVATTADDPNIAQLTEFFSETWPGESFITLRQDLRRDLEITGNAYLEVLRNISGDVVFLRRVAATMVRLVKLDDPVPVERVVRRRGQDVTVKLEMRERRFAQLVAGRALVYFREFGSSRELDKTTGKWVPDGEKPPVDRRASELLHFTLLPDARSPYGIPRWVCQTPSVVGSRQAEELNLDYFDHDGVPPVLILLQGGVLAHETRRALEARTRHGKARLNRLEIIEIEPSGGTLDQPGTASVRVERFGSERVSDSMFENYDMRCTERVRRAFRLPPMFLGQAADYNFATAYVSYAVAEAQVFKPERCEFDTVISQRLLPAMGFAGYALRSRPLQIHDAERQLAGLRVAQSTLHVSPRDVVRAVNEVVGLTLEAHDEPVAPPPAESGGDHMPRPANSAGRDEVGLDTGAGIAPGRVAKIADGILALAADALLALRQRDAAALTRALQRVQALAEGDRRAFRRALSTFQFIDPTLDSEGLAELSGCTLAVMAANGHCAPRH
jgi:PBSX family phage portal protein